MKMKVKQATALPKGFTVTALEMVDEVLTITALSTQVSPCCPLCGTPSTRTHSSYQCQVADLPCSGQRVRVLHVCKCFCEVSTCKRKIFAERIMPFVAPQARVTQRLFQIVQVIGLATGGRFGVRVTDWLGIQTSLHTILRRIMALPTRPGGIPFSAWLFRIAHHVATNLGRHPRALSWDALPETFLFISQTFILNDSVYISEVNSQLNMTRLSLRYRFFLVSPP
jgi:hypothetical protein